MERGHIKNDARRARRQDRLGGKNKTCLLCGDARIEVLVQVVKGFLQAHHITGRNHDPDLEMLVCPTCHAWVTALYRRNGVSMPRAPNLLRRFVARLRGFSTLLPEVAKSFDRWADEIEGLTDGLDARYPGWQDMPEAK